MKVLITGGAGLIGKATTQTFVEEGWDVCVIGLEEGIDIPGVEFVQCDVMDFENLRKQTHGCDAVVHLAAIRAPGLAPGHKVFEINVAGTYNVFEAAAAEGIGRVVQASSINAIGGFYNLTDIKVRYLPIDEEYPILTSDPYSYSKELIEDMGRYFWRRDGISSVALRFPGVYPSADLHTERRREYKEKARVILDGVLALPESALKARLAAVRERTAAWRKQRPLEFKERPPEMPRRDQSTSDEELFYLMYAVDRFNFWAFVDVQDTAQSILKGVTASYDGAHPLFINASQNGLDYDSRALGRIFFPEVDDEHMALSGTQSLVSIDKARKLIGFEPGADE